MFRLSKLTNAHLVVYSLVLVFVLAVVPEKSVAQSNSNDEAALDEIIVTSQKREQSLQVTPVAVTVFGGDDLNALGIFDIKGISEFTPGFSMGEFNPGQTQLYIRGIGSNEDSAGGDQSVVVFVDDIYISRSAGQDVDLFDIERVEVLRGPQGTLFGRNVVGGAISIVTKRPTDDPEFALEASVGSFDLMTLRGRASGPLAKNLYGKISFSSRSRGGYLENHIVDYPELVVGPAAEATLKDKVRKVNRDSINAGLRWVPSDTLEVNFDAKFHTVDEDGAVRHAIEGESSVWLFRADSQLIPNYANDSLAVLQDDVGYYTSSIWSSSVRIDWNISDNIELTSISAYRDVDTLNNEAGGFGGSRELGLLRLAAGAFISFSGGLQYADESQTFSQELRLASSGDGRLQWTGGLFFLKDDARRAESNTISVIFGPVAENNPGNSPAITDSINETTSYAAFGQLEYDLTDAFSVIVGGRYTKDEKRNFHDFTSNVTTGPDFTSVAKADWGEFTGKVGLNFQINDDAFLYGTIAEGYKAGGWGPGAAETIEQATIPFRPESATMYEIGAKTEWIDKRLRLNLAVFRTDYEDIQILQLLVPESDPPDSLGIIITQNAGAAEIEGAELEFTAMLLDNFLVQGSYTYLDAVFTDFFSPPGFRPPLGADSSSRIGNYLRNAPVNSYNIMARYSLPLDNGSEWRLQASYRHKDKAAQDPDNVPYAFVPAYDMTDLRATWVGADGNLELSAWVNNVFDEDYFLHAFPAVGDGIAVAGPPRMYGATVTLRY